jgi:long-chain fatty acid transport protein
MRKYLLTSVAILAAGPALAGGVERSNQSMAILFEQGNYLEFGASYTRPRVSGRGRDTLGPPFAGSSSGNMSEDFFALDLRFRGQINEQLSYAIIIDEPIGANVAYPSDEVYPLAGSTGTIESRALTGVVRYAFDGGFSVYGGLRAARTRGEVELVNPAIPGGYTMSTETDTAYGYLLGAAYEMPEIAGRVSLTYNSQITHDFEATENIPAFGIVDDPRRFSTTIPESVHLEFQTGIMEDTLLFGGIRWVRWSKFDITPPAYNENIGGSLVEYSKPTTTYTLGVGRRFTEQLSGSASISHERQSGGTLGNLGPTDGFTSVGLGASYTIDNITLSGGVQYRWIGGGDTAGDIGSFSGNSATSAGLRVGVRF